MNYLKKQINGKKVSILSIGSMRFKSKEVCTETILEGINRGITYIDTSPNYCYINDFQNCERWVGEAISGYREKVILSAKSSPGFRINNNFLPDYKNGHSICDETAVRKMIEQSLKRLEVDYLDCYQMWSVNDYQTFLNATQKGGWLDGVIRAKEDGLIKSIGITTHANNNVCEKFINSGFFETITLPFNILSTSRLSCIELANKKNISVFAMNPLGGGIIKDIGNDTINKKLKEFQFNSMVEFALLFCSMFGVSILSGIKNKNEIIENSEFFERENLVDISQMKKIQNCLLENVSQLSQLKCTNCGYCMPCPQGIHIPEILKHYNYYMLDSALLRNSLLEQIKTKRELNILRCKNCGFCLRKCPNEVEIISIFNEIKNML